MRIAMLSGMRLKLSSRVTLAILAAAIGGCPESSETKADGGGDHEDAALVTGDGGGSMQSIDCSGPLALAAYCDRKGMLCSTSFAELRESYCDPMYRHISTTVQANDCGGQSLLTRIGNSRMRFDYDAADELRAVQSGDDVPYGVCMRNQYTYGNPCELRDVAKPACPVDKDAGI